MLDKYDGTTNPDEHVDAYVTQVSLYTSGRSLSELVYPSSPTLYWLLWYPSHQVWNTIVTGRPHHLTLITLVNIRKE